MNKKIVLTGGGTAGHVMPNLALYPYLTPHFGEIHYIGSEHGIEREIVARYPSIIYHSVPTIKLRRSLDIRNLAIPFVLSRGISCAKKILKSIAPDVIFSKGGFVGLPVMLAANKIPLIIHESDRTLGLANKLAKGRASRILTAYQPLAGSLANATYVGTPIRHELYSGNASIVGYSTRKKILIVGGSTGSSAINEVVAAAIDELRASYEVIHLTGKGKGAQTACNHFTPIDYVHNIADYYAWADVVISRAGAGAIAELIALAKPSVLIPLPKGNSRGDQIDNAKYYTERGCFVTVSQDSLTAQTLLDSIAAVLSSKDSLTKAMQSICVDGTAKIVKIILSCLPTLI